MKLLTKTSIYHFWLSVFVLLLTGVLLLLFLRHEVSEEIEEQLEFQSTMIVDEMNAGKTISFPLVKILPVSQTTVQSSRVFRDTLIYDSIQRKKEGYYVLSANRQIKGKAFRVTVMVTHIGWDGYSKTIGYILIGATVMFLGFGASVNYFINKKIWHPFLINLKRLKSYSVSGQQSLQLLPSDIQEFKEMNLVLEELTEGAKSEYRALKEFTENASHEIQTPLSIVKTRLESIGQFKLEEPITRYVTDAKQAVNRLSRVNKGLLLLAKLEQRDFPDVTAIDLHNLLYHIIDQTEDIRLQRGIRLVKEIGHKEFTASTFLMESLLSNLWSNVLNHSKTNAESQIKLNNQLIEFSNEAPPLSFPEYKLFSRFTKGNDDYNGNGLGLAIVKQICVVHNWHISYRYHKGFHTFRIIFDPANDQSNSGSNR